VLYRDKTSIESDLDQAIIFLTGLGMCRAPVRGEGVEICSPNPPILSPPLARGRVRVRVGVANLIQRLAGRRGLWPELQAPTPIPAFPLRRGRGREPQMSAFSFKHYAASCRTTWIVARVASANPHPNLPPAKGKELEAADVCFLIQALTTLTAFGVYQDRERRRGQSRRVRRSLRRNRPANVGISSCSISCCISSLPFGA